MVKRSFMSADPNLDPLNPARGSGSRRGVKQIFNLQFSTYNLQFGQDGRADCHSRRDHEMANPILAGRRGQACDFAILRPIVLRIANRKNASLTPIVSDTA